MSKEHDVKTPFRARVVPRRDVDLASARFWKRGTGGGVIYYGRTTCPQCFAPDIEGHNIVVAHHEGGGFGDRVLADAPPTTEPHAMGEVEIPFECACSAAHDEEKTGCGARWVSVWREQDD